MAQVDTSGSVASQDSAFEGEVSSMFVAARTRTLVNIKMKLNEVKRMPNLVVDTLCNNKKITYWSKGLGIWI